MPERTADELAKAGRRPRTLWLVIAVAVLLSFTFAITQRAGSPDELVSDSAVYHSLGARLASEGSLGDATYWPPGYPALLALVYTVVGHSLWAVYLVQSLLLGVTLFLVHRIALHITRSKAAALIAVSLCALWPPMWIAVGDVMTEMLASALVAASLWLLIVAMREGSWRVSAAAGILIGAASLTKAVFLPFALVAALFVVFSGRDRIRRLAPALMLLLFAAGTIMPWSVRNHRVTGELVPIATGVGFNFWLGNWPDHYHTRWEWRNFPPPLDKMLHSRSEVEQDRILMRQGLACIGDNPLRAAGLMLRKFSNLWLGAFGADPRSSGNPILHFGSFGVPKRSVAYVPLFAAAVAGWVMLPRDAKRRAWPMTALLAAWTVPYVATTAVARYATPVAFYEILLAAVVPWRLCVMKGRSRL